MANGDDAAAVGFDTVPGTADRRNGYDEINKTRDYVARHQSSGTHPASAITSGVLDQARIPTIPTSKLTGNIAPVAFGITASNLPSNNFSVQNDINQLNSAIASKPSAGSTWTGSLDTDGSVRALYNRNNSITTGYVAAYIDYRGVFGPPASTRAVKQDIRPAAFTREQLRAIEPVLFRYIDAVELEAEGFPAAQTMLGLIAEDLHDLGLWPFVRYEGRGEDAVPAGINMEMMGLAAIMLAKDSHNRIDDLETRLSALEGSAA